jgi:hypothetical protein
MALAVFLGATTVGDAAAQGSRQQAGTSLSVTRPVGKFDLDAVPACADANRTAAMVRVDSAPNAPTPVSSDLADDAIDPDILAPGSGMVVVDAHGREMHMQDYTARSGSSALDRCAEAMKPPPSNRSPL